MFSVEGSYISLETNEKVIIFEMFESIEKVDNYICDLLKSYATNIKYRVYQDNDEFPFTWN